jgi:hypothetical protein
MVRLASVPVVHGPFRDLGLFNNGRILFLTSPSLQRNVFSDLPFGGSDLLFSQDLSSK